MYANFNDKFKVGKLLKDMMWRVTLGYERDFKRAIDHVEHTYKEAYEWFAAKPVDAWTLSGLSPSPTCDTADQQPFGIID